ncbi:MAG: Asp-tRNA(Asn)/Glu-tRNA(Gln) amidotransferase subunit GatB [Deltaproteobacteria bacterium]|nr:MAG: Asp-tRNA(Asn)/Glu-tRNA(Gln) amidotransferase subunit GatB [Deltaproteobacteria bacterium]
MSEQISREQVRHVAALARLEMDEEELAAYGRDLSDILGYVAKLNEIDTSGVEPTAHVVSMETPFRDDERGESFSHEQALKNAPQREGFYFQVPQVIE